MHLFAQKKAKWLSPGRAALLSDIGLLVLRVGIGLFMALGHGLGKLQNFGVLKDKFPDPLGVGSTLSVSLAIGAELGASILLVLGLATRLATLPLIFTMGVAAFVIHSGDPFWQQGAENGAKEFALLYMIPYLCLLFTGPGRISVDHLLVRD